MKYLNDKIYAQSVMGLIVWLIHILAMIYRLDPPIVVTSCWRENDPKYHGRNQAKDVRTRDWPAPFMFLVGNVLQKIRESNPRIQFDIESDHLHLEYDDKSLK
jgi:hypothetical protein